MAKRTKRKSGRCDWPPKEYRLPNTIAEIEAGRPDPPPRQLNLFPEADQGDSRTARVAHSRRGIRGNLRRDRLPTFAQT